MQRRLAVRALIIREGKLFAVRLKQYHSDTPDAVQDFWCLPGGGVDDFESLIPALEREMLEETGIPATIGNLLYVQQFSHEGREHLEFFFHVTNADDYLNVDLTATTHGTTEIEEVGFIDPRSVKVLPTFLASEDLVAKVAGVTPVEFFDFLDQ